MYDDLNKLMEGSRLTLYVGKKVVINSVQGLINATQCFMVIGEYPALKRRQNSKNYL